MNAKLQNTVVEYAHKVFDENLFGRNVNNISVRATENSMYITKSGVNFKELSAEDVIEVFFDKTDRCPSDTLKEALMHVKLYGENPHTGAVMVTSPVFALAVANKKVSIPPVLDDMAQIVGPTARTAKTNDISGIRKALKGRTACLLSDIGILATGKTLNEAFTSCLVIDKAAHTLIMSQAVGGCKPVGKIGALLEHVVYMKKYSKTNQEELLKAERE